MPRSSAPTMSDVAARAGVSHQTVSRVLNDADAVRPETRERVQRAIDELGYRRNSAARALVTRRSGLLGVVVDELPFYGPASTVTSIAAAARDAGYGITLDPLPALTGSTLAAAIEHHMNQAVEAIILVAAHGHPPDTSLLATSDVPILALDGFLGPGAPTAGVDQRAGGEIATRHLLDLGHRRVAHVAGPDGWPQAAARLRGFHDAMAGAGLPPGPVAVGDWTPHTGYAAMSEILETDREVTAVFVANDQMAAGALRAVTERGLTVGVDVSVVGFDDVPEAAYLHPALTTVRQDFAALGREAVRLVLTVLAGEDPGSALVPARLVARASSGPRRPTARPR